MSNLVKICALMAVLADLAGCSSSSNGEQNSTPPVDAGSSTNLDASVDSGLFHIDRSGLTNVGPTSPLDYSNPNLWICRPGIDSNPCYGDHGELDTTELLPDGGRQIVKHQRAANPKFDCFYVYPTVYLTGNGNQTNLSDDSYPLDALMAQGARMSELCEVYAPLYRQIMFTPSASAPLGTLSDAGSPDSGPADAAPTDAAPADAGASSGGGVAGLLGGPEAALALGDVRNAFKFYMDHFNNGRKFVLLGHSQGSGMLQGMMQQDIDKVSDVRSKMISAVLLGGGATVASGQTLGGTFTNIPTCTSPGETGCLVSYSSFDVLSPPGSNTLFGVAPSGQQTVCTEPAALAGNDAGIYGGSYFPTHINNPLLAPTTPTPDAGTAFILYADAFQGQCINQNGVSYLQITNLVSPGDPRGTPPYVSTTAESLGFGLHLVDWNLPMKELIGIVSQQAAKAVP